MINHIPVNCSKFQKRDEVCPIIQTYPAIYPEGEAGPGINEYPVDYCLNCGQSMIKADEPFCLNCRAHLSKQGSTHSGATLEGSHHTYVYKCDRCNLNYYSFNELF